MVGFHIAAVVCLGAAAFTAFATFVWWDDWSRGERGGAVGTVLALAGVGALFFAFGLDHRERMQQQAFDQAIELMAVSDGIADFSAAPELCREWGRPGVWFLERLRAIGWVQSDRDKSPWLFRNVVSDRSDETIKAIKQAKAKAETDGVSE